jgi:predicted DNA-binding antitoxin AbrB/MazE fold protein
MTIRCAAIFEKGVLRPKQPIALPEGAEVALAVEYAEPTKPPGDIAKALAAIAKLPMESDDAGFSGADHDKVLYGEAGAR